MYNNLSLIHFKQKNYKESIQYSDKAILIQSNNIKAYLRKANCMLMLWEFDEAVKLIEVITDLDQNSR